MTTHSSRASLNPEVFLTAAHLIEDGRRLFACNAIDFASVGCDERAHRCHGSPEEAFFVGLFNPSDQPMTRGTPFWGDPGDREATQARITALLLCYWMAKGGAK